MWGQCVSWARIPSMLLTVFGKVITEWMESFSSLCINSYNMILPLFSSRDGVCFHPLNLGWARVCFRQQNMVEVAVGQSKPEPRDSLCTLQDPHLHN